MKRNLTHIVRSIFRLKDRLKKNVKGKNKLKPAMKRLWN